VIELSRRQLDFGDGLIAEEVGELWEDWMRHVDAVLDDPLLLDAAYQALARRWTHSRTCGRRGTPVDVVVRLLVLKHMRNWSYAALEREVRSNLVYRQFTRIGAAKVPDAKTLGKLGIALGPAVIEQIHQRIVAIAQEQKVVRGRRMRVDTTVVETDIHYPTDASLLGDGVRVLTRAMKRIAELTGDMGTRLRNRTRSTRRCLNQLGRAVRGRGEQSRQRMVQCYGRLMAITQRVVGQARRFVREMALGIKRCRRRRDWAIMFRNRLYLETMIPRVRQVLQQTRQRIDEGNTHAPGKIVSLFEPQTEIIRKVRREVAYIIVSPAHKVGDETGRSVGRSLPVHVSLATAACEATGTTCRAFEPRRLPRGSGVTCQHQRGWGARLSGMVNRSELLQASL
jgi:transposase, IS5 family